MREWTGTMARPRTFDEATALDAAIKVFSDRGFKGATTQDLIDATGIGRQSLYNIFGDKWGLYVAAFTRHCEQTVAMQLKVIENTPNAFEAIEAAVDRITRDGIEGSLGVSAVLEFGMSRSELFAIHFRAAETIEKGLQKRVIEARKAGDIASGIDTDRAVAFIITLCAGAQIAARRGVTLTELRAINRLGLRALR